MQAKLKIKEYIDSSENLALVSTYNKRTVSVRKSDGVISLIPGYGQHDDIRIVPENMSRIELEGLYIEIVLHGGFRIQIAEIYNSDSSKAREWVNKCKHVLWSHSINY